MISLKKIEENEYESYLKNIPSEAANLLVKNSMLIQMKGYPTTKCDYFIYERTKEKGINANETEDDNQTWMVNRMESHTNSNWFHLSFYIIYYKYIYHQI